MKEAHKKANRRKTLMEQELKNLKGEKMRMYEEYAAGTLPLDTYKQKKQECDRRISEVEEKIELEKEWNPLGVLCRELCVQRQSRQRISCTVRGSRQVWYRPLLKMSLCMMEGVLWYGSNTSRAYRIL